MQGRRALRILLVSILATGLFGSTASAAGGDEGTWELGVFAGYGFPDGYGGLDPEDDLLYGARLGFFYTPYWSLETSYQRLSSETIPPPPAAARDFDIQSGRLNVLYNFLPGRMFRPFVTAGVGIEGVEAQGSFASSDFGVNAGVGARWFANDWFGLRLDWRYVFTDVGAPVQAEQGNLEATAGLVFSFGGGPPTDSDGDGVVDRRDDCPDTPLGAVVDERGCPLDSDQDGVFDGLDRCPDTPRGCPVDVRGCPTDADGDGVLDCNDRCAGTPKGCEVEATGCPKDLDGDSVCDGLDRCPATPAGCQVDATGCPKDLDGDSVCDGLDRCPATPAGCQVDATGCPKDTDGDGVCDGLDRCPDTAPGRKVDAKGCEQLVFNEKGALRLEGVNFEFDSDRLTPESLRILDGVAASLREWSDLKVDVEGHTDSIGTEAYNLDLSRRRAAAVRQYLVVKGVDGSRLIAKGYGESRPETSNKTREGRAQNRRVELKRLK